MNFAHSAEKSVKRYLRIRHYFVPSWSSKECTWRSYAFQPFASFKISFQKAVIVFKSSSAIFYADLKVSARKMCGKVAQGEGSRNFLLMGGKDIHIIPVFWEDHDFSFYDVEELNKDEFHDSPVSLLFSRHQLHAELKHIYDEESWLVGCWMGRDRRHC